MQNFEKPLALEGNLSYRNNVTFSGICQYLLALQMARMLLTEKLNTWSCQCSSYEDSTWSQDTINYFTIASLFNSGSLDDHTKNLLSLYSQFLETLQLKYFVQLITKLTCTVLFSPQWWSFCKALMRKSPMQQTPTISL